MMGKQKEMNEIIPVCNSVVLLNDVLAKSVNDIRWQSKIEIFNCEETNVKKMAFGMCIAVHWECDIDLGRVAVRNSNTVIVPVSRET